MPLEARGATAFCQPTRRRPLLSCPAPPRPAAPPCAAPPQPTLGVTVLWVRPVSFRAFLKKCPGHTLHNQDLQRQIGAGTLVSSQERSAALALLIHRGSIAGFVPPSVYVEFRLFVLPTSRLRQLSSMLWIPWGGRGQVVSWPKKPVGVPSCPAPFRPAALSCAIRPDPRYVQVLDSKINGSITKCRTSQSVSSLSTQNWVPL